MQTERKSSLQKILLINLFIHEQVSITVNTLKKLNFIFPPILYIIIALLKICIMLSI